MYGNALLITSFWRYIWRYNLIYRQVKYEPIIKQTNSQSGKNLSYNAKGKNKYADGGGLYLLITANGAKHWRMDYRRPVTQKKIRLL